MLQNSSPRQIILRRGIDIAQLVIMPVVQVRWQDMSGQVSISGEKTDPSTVLLDSEMAVSAEENEVMTSSKRVVKSPRNRFAEDDKDA